MTTIKLWNGSGPFKADTSEFIFPAWKSLWCYDYSLLLCNCPAVTGSVWMFQSSHLNCSLCLSCAGYRLRTACRHAVLRRATGPEGAKGVGQWAGQRCQVSAHSHLPFTPGGQGNCAWQTTGPQSSFQRLLPLHTQVNKSVQCDVYNTVIAENITEVCMSTGCPAG